MYETIFGKRANENVKNEFEIGFGRDEQASGSQDNPRYDYPESTHERKGNRGRLKNSQETCLQKKQRHMLHEENTGESKASTPKSPSSKWTNRALSEIVDAYNQRTCGIQFKILKTW